MRSWLRTNVYALCKDSLGEARFVNWRLCETMLTTSHGFTVKAIPELHLPLLGRTVAISGPARNDCGAKRGDKTLTSSSVRAEQSRRST